MKIIIIINIMFSSVKTLINSCEKQKKCLSLAVLYLFWYGAANTTFLAMQNSTMAVLLQFGSGRLKDKNGD